MKKQTHLKREKKRTNLRNKKKKQDNDANRRGEKKKKVLFFREPSCLCIMKRLITLPSLIVLGMAADDAVASREDSSCASEASPGMSCDPRRACLPAYTTNGGLDDDNELYPASRHASTT